MEIINLTPHDIVILDPSCAEYDSTRRNYSLVGEMKIIQTITSNGIARCKSNENELYKADGIQFIKIEFSDIEGLPEPKQDTYYIVSSIVASAASKNRDDLLLPARTVRDSSGKIIGCLALSLV